MTLQSDPGFPPPRSLLDFLQPNVVVPYADPPGNGGVDRDPFTLSGSVGRNGENARPDVIKAQILLANAGYHDLPDPMTPAKYRYRWQKVVR